MKAIVVLLILLFSSNISSLGQGNKQFSLKAGTGYFGNVWFKQNGPSTNETYNPKLYNIHHGNGLFFECSYQMKNDYGIGIKIMKAETSLPYNDTSLKELLYDFSSIASYNSYELFFNYSFSIKQHHVIVGCGPIMCKLTQSYYSGIINETYTDEWGHLFGKIHLYSNIITERHFWDMGINPKIDYEYMINPSIGLGIKAEAYLLAYMGLSYIFISPTIILRY